MKSSLLCFSGLAAFVLPNLVIPNLAFATTVSATTANYQSLLGTLAPGDTLVLAAGNYPGLDLTQIQGTTLIADHHHRPDRRDRDHRGERRHPRGHPHQLA